MWNQCWSYMHLEVCDDAQYMTKQAAKICWQGFVLSDQLWARIQPILTIVVVFNFGICRVLQWKVYLRGKWCPVCAFSSWLCQCAFTRSRMLWKQKMLQVDGRRHAYYLIPVETDIFIPVERKHTLFKALYGSRRRLGLLKRVVCEQRSAFWLREREREIERILVFPPMWIPGVASSST